MRNTVPLKECLEEAYLKGPTVYNPSKIIPNDPELPDRHCVPGPQRGQHAGAANVQPQRSPGGQRLADQGRLDREAMVHAVHHRKAAGSPGRRGALNFRIRPCQRSCRRREGRRAPF